VGLLARQGFRTVFDLRRDPGDGPTEVLLAVVGAGTLPKKTRPAGKAATTAAKGSRQLTGVRSKGYRSYKILTGRHLALRPRQREHLLLLFLSKEQQTSGSEPAIFAQRRQTEVAEAETEEERRADIVVVVVMVLVVVLQRKESVAQRWRSAYL
jgi:hypothetical protein